jgi:hypothetical protein
MAPLLDSSSLPNGFRSGYQNSHSVPSEPIDGTDLVDSDKLEPIAIVGFSFRFPGKATDSKAFWQMMMDKRCAVTDSPEDRISVSGWYHPDRRRRGQVGTVILQPSSNF